MTELKLEKRCSGLCWHCREAEPKTLAETVNRLEKELDGFFARWDALVPVEVPEVFCGKYHVRRRQRCEQCNSPISPSGKRVEA